MQPTSDRRPPTSDPGRVRSPERSEELETVAEGETFGADRGRGTRRGPRRKAFFPSAPCSLAEAQVGEVIVEGIILRRLTHEGSLKGAEISQLVGLPFAIVEKLLHGLKARRLLRIERGQPVGLRLRADGGRRGEGPAGRFALQVPRRRARFACRLRSQRRCPVAHAVGG